VVAHVTVLGLDDFFSSKTSILVIIDSCRVFPHSSPLWKSLTDSIVSTACTCLFKDSPSSAQISKLAPTRFSIPFLSTQVT
jgi:hypothetical protein